MKTLIFSLCFFCINIVNAQSPIFELDAQCLLNPDKKDTTGNIFTDSIMINPGRLVAFNEIADDGWTWWVDGKRLPRQKVPFVLKIKVSRNDSNIVVLRATDIMGNTAMDTLTVKPLPKPEIKLSAYGDSCHLVKLDTTRLVGWWWQETINIHSGVVSSKKLGCPGDVTPLVVIGTNSCIHRVDVYFTKNFVVY